jgi:hypothetical protein
MCLFSLSGEDAAEAGAEICVAHRLPGEIDDGVGAAEFVECGVRHDQLDEHFGGADREIEFDEAIVAAPPDADEFGAEQFARFALGSPHILLLSRASAVRPLASTVYGAIFVPIEKARFCAVVGRGRMTKLSNAAARSTFL